MSLLSEDLFPEEEDKEQREQFQNFINITLKMNTTDNPEERDLCQTMINSFYGRFMELLQVNLENGYEEVFIRFNEETTV